MKITRSKKGKHFKFTSLVALVGTNADVFPLPTNKVLKIHTIYYTSTALATNFSVMIDSNLDVPLDKISNLVSGTPTYPNVAAVFGTTKKAWYFPQGILLHTAFMKLSLKHSGNLNVTVTVLGEFV
jgi:hypothetical protein